jgi:preprotein translocase subunit SecD
MFIRIALMRAKLKTIVFFLLTVIVGVLFFGCISRNTLSIYLENDAKDKIFFHIEDESSVFQIDLSANDILKMSLNMSRHKDPELIINFTEIADEYFYRLTYDNIGKTINIYFYNILFASAIIRYPFKGGMNITINSEKIELLVSNNAFSSNDLKKIKEWLKELEN